MSVGKGQRIRGWGRTYRDRKKKRERKWDAEDITDNEKVKGENNTRDDGW